MNRKDLARARELGRPTNLQRGHASSWYRIRNISDTETEVYIYDEIGYFGVSADDFVRDLADIETPRIRLRVNSPGGDVFDGIAIYNGISTHPATVTAQVDGLAASAASFIICAADTTEIHRNAQIMVHDARGICVGNAADMQEMLDLLNMASDNIADIYAQKTGGDAAEWRAVMRGEKWYTATEAADAGLVDSVIEKPTKDDATPEGTGDGQKAENKAEELDFDALLQGIDLAAITKNAFEEDVA